MSLGRLCQCSSLHSSKCVLHFEAHHVADLRCKFVRKNMDDLHAKSSDHGLDNFFAWNTSLFRIEELLLAKNM